mgnify:CR=1 FL=1
MGMFDQAARFAVKIDAAGFFRWLLGDSTTPLVFRDWLDTRRVPTPGGADLTGDVVAEFDNGDQPGESFALILELQTEPATDIVERVTLYALQLRRELQRGAVGAAIINLTGSPAPAELNLPMPGMPGLGMFLKPLQCNLQERDALTTLAEIAAGQTARCILPWIPLMRGADLPVIMEWKRLAEPEPDSTLRSAYASVALVFAELTKGLVLWQNALENWNMRESQIILGWKREGEAEGRLKAMQEGILKVLQARLHMTIPEDITLALRGTNDLDKLSEWLIAAATTASLDEFRAALT